MNHKRWTIQYGSSTMSSITWQMKRLNKEMTWVAPIDRLRWSDDERATMRWCKFSMTWNVVLVVTWTMCCRIGNRCVMCLSDSCWSTVACSKQSTSANNLWWIPQVVLYPGCSRQHPHVQDTSHDDPTEESGWVSWSWNIHPLFVIGVWWPWVRDTLWPRDHDSHVYIYIYIYIYITLKNQYGPI